MTARGVNLVGYLNHVLGLGESARRCAGALNAAGIPHALGAIDLGDLAPRLTSAPAPWLAEARLPFDLTVLWCNPDRYGIDVDPATVPGRRLVGRWAWELPELPESWRAAAPHFCEIWTPSAFVAAAVRGGVDLPVRVLTPAIEVEPVGPLDRQRWRIGAKDALFLFMFDYHSTTVRKNPLGLVAAFAQAFPDGRRAKLLIKTINAADAPMAAAELAAAASDHPGIMIADVVLTPDERSALVGGCDCYVSLHRSEGFGMTIAEAMGYARPVIATDFGGCTDLIDSSTGYPVLWTATPVRDENGVYPQDGVWAEPELAGAAGLMREVIARPRDAAARGARAAERIATRHSPAAVGRTIVRELERLGAL